MPEESRIVTKSALALVTNYNKEAVEGEMKTFGKPAFVLE